VRFTWSSRWPGVPCSLGYLAGFAPCSDHVSVERHLLLPLRSWVTGHSCRLLTVSLSPLLPLTSVRSIPQVDSHLCVVSLRLNSVPFTCCSPLVGGPVSPQATAGLTHRPYDTLDAGGDCRVKLRCRVLLMSQGSVHHYNSTDYFQVANRQ